MTMNLLAWKENHKRKIQKIHYFTVNDTEQLQYTATVNCFLQLTVYYSYSVLQNWQQLGAHPLEPAIYESLYFSDFPLECVCQHGNIMVSSNKIRTSSS